MNKFINHNIFLLSLIFIVFIFFSPVFLKGLLPIPSDTIIGMYHPFRDLYAKDYPNGIPFKNFLITDPVRQIYPWKILSVETMKSIALPLWNPYEAAGKPLLANFQSSPFYPLNVLLLIKPFYLSWSLFILLQIVLAGLFLYIFLSSLKLDKRAVFLGVLSFCFSGFFISWLEWGTVLHTALWLPLILLSIDKIIYHLKTQNNFELGINNSKLQIKKYLVWGSAFTFSLISSFFAGHLQIFFYVFIFSFVYLISRWFQFGRSFKLLFLLLVSYVLFLILTSIQWIPTLQLILLSARDVDQGWVKEGWFIPWQNLIQYIAPDFFGNPATLNYWGEWNYGELVGYTGLIPLYFALLSMIFRYDKKTIFFGVAFFVSLLFSLPNFIAKIPYVLNIPFISTSQPTRLLFVSAFSLSVLSSLGFDYFLKLSLKYSYKKILVVFFIFSLIFISLWMFVLFGEKYFSTFSMENLLVAKRNLFFPTFIFAVFTLLIFMYFFISKKMIRSFIIIFILAISSFELLRFGMKFEPFTKKEYLFPSTKIIEFLKKQNKPFRIAATDSRIFPPNFSTYYKIESIETYDPLYLLSFAQLIAASERGKPDISYPYGFNRIITPHNMESKLIDLLNVKYVLSLSEINSKKFKKVFEEGNTIVYENNNVVPRVFFVKEVIVAKNEQEAINVIFSDDFDPKSMAVINESRDIKLKGITSVKKDCEGEAKIISYKENIVVIETENDCDGYLVFSDAFYPTWWARTEGYDSDNLIIKTNYHFRGIFVPRGKHKITFKNSFFHID